jgi:hypothetical protein
VGISLRMVIAAELMSNVAVPLKKSFVVLLQQNLAVTVSPVVLWNKNVVVGTAGRTATVAIQLNYVA